MSRSDLIATVRSDDAFAEIAEFTPMVSAAVTEPRRRMIVLATGYHDQTSSCVSLFRRWRGRARRTGLGLRRGRVRNLFTLTPSRASVHCRQPRQCRIYSKYLASDQGCEPFCFQTAAYSPLMPRIAVEDGGTPFCRGLRSTSASPRFRGTAANESPLSCFPGFGSRLKIRAALRPVLRLTVPKEGRGSDQVTSKLSIGLKQQLVSA